MNIQRNPLKTTINHAEVVHKLVHENRVRYGCGLFAESLPCARYASLQNPMALTDAVARQARTTGKAYTLNDSDGLSLFVTGKGAMSVSSRG
ncbi:DUF4102 domain-containing protein [Brenneria izadpanahii]|uniref:DUF4102 domain-containing protein n=1 Tax=Brenneria izadpanahii TaxID=2722756 RepID=UPI001AAE478A|nr:DUF4102 domain-containing protein [Brenneria izadpanahii]